MTEAEIAIIAELKKLNSNMEKLLCFQKLAAQRYEAKYGAPMGPIAGSDMEGKNRVSDLRTPTETSGRVSS